MATSPPFSNSYIVTNRNDPYTWFPDSTYYVVPLPAGELSFSTAGSPYDQSPDDYSDVTSSSDEFMSQLQADLEKTVDANGQANLAIYIHGLGNTYDDAITGTAALGSALFGSGYTGLVIGFSWPSYSDLVAPLASYYATSRPPQSTSGTIRDNINGSTGSFVTLIQALLALQVNSQAVNLNIISHSEGNFMLVLGMEALSQAGVTSGISNAILLAADISAVLLQQGQWGDALTGICGAVTVYYSGADADLCYSNYEFFAFHDQTYPTRLGLVGPYGYPAASTIPSSVTGIDCSLVTVNLGSPLNVHSSYLSLPQTLADMSSVLSATAPTGRAQLPGTTLPSYYLSPTVNQAAGFSVHQGIFRRRQGERSLNRSWR
jgi:esterase/lipase superfamily enzyme